MSTTKHKVTNEAQITINGVLLSEGESCAVRVALTNMQNRMSKPNVLGKDETGRAITAGYYQNASSVLRLIFEGSNRG